MFTIVKIKYQKCCLTGEVNFIFIVKPLNILYMQVCVGPLMPLLYSFKIINDCWWHYKLYNQRWTSYNKNRFGVIVMQCQHDNTDVKPTVPTVLRLTHCIAMWAYPCQFWSDTFIVAYTYVIYNHICCTKECTIFDSFSYFL